MKQMVIFKYVHVLLPPKAAKHFWPFYHFPKIPPPALTSSLRPCTDQKEFGEKVISIS